MGRKIGRRMGRPASRQIGRSCDQNDPINPNLSLDKVGIRKRAKVAPHGDVEAFAHQIDETIGDVKPDLNLRVSLRQKRQLIGKTKLSIGHGGGDIDDAARLSKPAARKAFSSLGLDHGGAGVFVEFFTHVREHEASGGTLHQPHTQRGFEFGDTFAHRRFGTAEPATGRCKATEIHRVNEKAQIVEVHITKSIVVNIKATVRNLDRQSP